MMKPWLLIVNDQYYPSHGTGDWRGFFETEEEAISKGQKLAGTTDEWDVDHDKSYTVVNVWDKIKPKESNDWNDPEDE